MDDQFQDWDSFTVEFVTRELPRLLIESEKAIAAVECSDDPTFEDFYWGLEDATRSLWRLWACVGHMTSVMNSDAWRKVEIDFQPQVVSFSLRVGQSRALYERAKKALDYLSEDDSPLAATRRRILEKMILSSEESGVALDGVAKTRFNEIVAELAKLSTDFANTVIDATAAFSLEKEGKTYTIDDANYPETMKHCPDREVRERLCRARAARAPENAARIDRILSLRTELAGFLGYANYAELSLASKCAPGMDAVFRMIRDLDEATVVPASREESELSESATGLSLEPWDQAFYAERLRESRYAYSESELKRYFELEDVLKGLFQMTNFLFGVEVVEISARNRPSVWHPDVRFFAVRENGCPVAYFYFDPYVRTGLKQGGAWMNEFRNRCDRLCQLPVAVLVTNFPMRDANGKCLLPFREVETLFHEFGHALQCMLTRVGEEGAAGIRLVEWDAVEVASQFMENWCLDDRTGIVVPSDLKAKVRTAKNFRAATACRRQLAFAETDMMLHGPCSASRTSESPDALKMRLFAHYGVPIVSGDRFLCSFSHIFAGGYAAGYYGYKWAEVMSADCYGAFEESGLADDAAVRELGRHFRETVLGLGGSVSAIEAFRAFRHRDPEIAALLRQQGLA